MIVVLFLFGSAQIFAQTVVWTGDYYVVAAMNEKGQYAVNYGHHLDWNGLKAGPNFQGGTFSDLTVAPSRMFATELLPPQPPSRYRLLAVGDKDGQAYAVTGSEDMFAPRFDDTMEPIANLNSATAAAWAGSYYVVLGRAMGGDGVLPTPRDVVAYGQGGDGEWYVSYLPFNDDIELVDIAVGAVLDPTSKVASPYQILAIGMHRDGRAFAMFGYERDGAPVFSGDTIPISESFRPISVEWTGSVYVIVGEQPGGDFTILYGDAYDWLRSKDISLNDGKFTSFAVAPRERGYDLMAVGAIKDRVFSLPGTGINGTPIFEGDWKMIPDLLGFGNNRVEGDNDDAGLLGRPHPNPFNPQTSFTIALLAEQTISVEVFNVLGQRVDILHNGLLTSGQHTFTFDGAGLPSGVYILRASGDGFVETQHINLLK